MLRIFVAVAAAATLLAPGIARAAHGDAFELHCERQMKPVLEVTASSPSFDLDNTVSSRVLHTRYRQASVSQLSLGLTAGQMRTEITFDAPALLDTGGKRECVAPHIYVELGYHPLSVYVAREFNPYSCSYRAIYAHEMEHIRIYRDELPAAQRTVQDELLRRYGGHPLYAPAGRGIALLEADVDQWLRPLIQRELARIEAEQAALDSPEETFRLSHACHGEVASLVGSFL